jgi:RNA polymerase sigma-70 factor (ECF subfamily)
LIRRVRAGDEQAAAELVRDYEEAIRLVVRLRLTDPALRRLLDSMDICQSVLGEFFVRATRGQFELEEPKQLVRLLTTMARNKITNYALQQQAARRDCRRLAKAPADEGQWPASGPSPSQEVIHQELLREFRSRLSEEERRLADLHAEGRPWAEIAAEVGGTPDGVRVRLARAIDRISEELKLGEQG